MDRVLGDLLLEADAWQGDLVGALAGLYGYTRDTVYLFHVHDMPNPPENVALIVSWNMKQGAYPLHLAVGPFGDHLPMKRIAALKQLCRALHVACIADIGEDVLPEWVRVSPNGRVEPVDVDEAALDEDRVLVHALDAPVTAD